MFSKIRFPKDWLFALSDLIHDETMGLSLKKVTALCVAVVDDDPAAGLMLEQILYWYGRNNGEFYMSARQWYDDYRITPSRVRKAKKTLARCGVLTEVKKANGAPTTHYSLNPWRFVARLARVVQSTIIALLNRFACLAQMDLAESDKSLTISTSIKTSKKVNDKESPLPEKVNEIVSSDVDQVSMLLKAGLFRDVASRFVDLPVETVQACIDSSRKPHVKYRIKYLTSALEEQLQKLNNAEEEKRDWSAFINQPVDDAEDDAPFEFKFKGVPYEQDKPIEATISDGVDVSAAEAWRNVEARLRSEFGERFEQWFKDAEVDCADGGLVVMLANRLALDCVQDHRVVRVINKLISEANLSVRFEAQVNELPFKFLRQESD